MTTPSYAPGKTFFDTSVKRPWADVPVDKEHDNAVSTAEFLEAAEVVLVIFDSLGSVAFSAVKNDIAGNIKKVKERMLAKPAESTTLQDLVRNELKEGKHVATEGLLWLVRGLDFTCAALTANCASQTEELTTSFRNAYGGTLKPHHSFLVKPIFSAAMSACPYRKDFYAKLAGPNDQALLTEQLTKWTKDMGDVVALLKGFLDRKEAKW